MLTVVIATRNGEPTLPAVLQQYCNLTVPRGGWKLVVVDNGSTDRTAEIIQSFQDRLPITYVFEDVNGKNVAVNKGLLFVSGDLVIFSDDDVFPRADWLVQFREAADANPEYGMFGGVVIPRWQRRPPDWLLKNVPMDTAYTVSDSRLSDGEVDAGHLFGPNFAIRAELFEGGEQFETSIGPMKSSCYAMGSETELVLRLEQRGVRACYLSNAVVEHFVRSRQLRPLWLLGRAMRAGRGKRRLLHLGSVAVGESDRPTAFRCLLRLGRRGLGAMLASIAFDRGRLLACSWALSFVAGYTFEAIFPDGGTLRRPVFNVRSLETARAIHVIPEHSLDLSSFD